DIDPEWRIADALLQQAQTSFVAAHRKLYGHGNPTADLELVSVRCRAIGKVRSPTLTPPATEGTDRRETRGVYFREGGMVETPVLQRDSLRIGQTIVGPAIIDEWAM